MNSDPTITGSNILTKGLQSELADTPIEEGKLRFTTDTGRLYFDVSNSSRILISETVDIYTESQIKNDIIAPLPKVYVSSDTHRAFVYSYSTLSWIDLADVKLTVSPSENTEKVLWFSETSDTQPEYDASITYNTSTDTLTVPNIKTTTTFVGNMRITNTENVDHSHDVVFEFV